MKCPKCRGLIEHQIDGDMCRICGFFILAQIEPVPERPAVHDDGNPRPTKDYQLVKCPVCGRNMRSYRDTPYCSKCDHKMHDWEASNKRYPAPVVCIDGKWMRNPEWKRRTKAKTGAESCAAAQRRGEE